MPSLRKESKNLLSSSASRRSNHRRHYNQNPKPAHQSDPIPFTSLFPTPPPVERQPTSSTTHANSATTTFQIIWGTQKSATESDIMEVVSPRGALSNTCKPLVIQRSYKPLGTKKTWWFTIIGEEETIWQVEQKWNQIKRDDRWILLKSLQDRPRPALPSGATIGPRLASAPNPVFSNPPTAGPPSPGPYSDHSADTQQSQ